MRPVSVVAMILALPGMTMAGGICAWMAHVTPARAQTTPIQSAPLPPLQQQQQQGSPQPDPQLRQINPGPNSLGQVGPGPANQALGQAPQMTPPATADRPNVWLPAVTAKLQALDKVNAQATELTVKVGQLVTFGSLTITVKACMIRPPDQPADAAAYLDVTDSHADSPGFDGWMLQDEPAVSMMQHPIYDIRVTGCA